MYRKHVIIHRNTGEPDLNGSTVAKDCKVHIPNRTMFIHLNNSKKSIPVGLATNIVFDGINVYADILLLPFITIFGEYAVTTMLVHEPWYNVKIDFEEQLKLSITKTSLIAIKLVEKPADPGIQKVVDTL